jgi:hypothetical protein
MHVTIFEVTRDMRDLTGTARKEVLGTGIIKT